MNKMVIAAACLAGWLSATAQTQKWFDTSLPMEERIESLIGEMTAEEKISQLVNEAPGIERLGVLPYDWWNEALHGVARNGRATVFPQAIGLAATFDEELALRVATAISDEARAKFNVAQANGNYGIFAGLTFWTPNVNIFRDPRWGRGQETYGEDPYLSSRMGLAFVRGLQGDDPNYLKTAACAKHYAVHSGPEALRHEFDVWPSRKDLYETYLPAFEVLVREGNVEAVMGAYNRVYGDPACASPLLLDTILKQHWGFDGHIVSDCGAIDDFWNAQQLVRTPAEAAAMAVHAGVNLNCGNTYLHLNEALKQGMVTEEQIDGLLRTLLATRFKLGLFDPKDDNPYNSIPESVVESEEHKALAREVAAKSFVLLKNKNNVLPLDKDIRRLYVTGPLAADAGVMLGNYYGMSSSITTILEGITSKVSIGTTIDYKPGILLDRPNLNPIDWTTGDAKRADAMVVVLGISGLLEGEEGESIASPYKGDRFDLNLPQNQIEFLKTLRKNNDKPIIVVMTGGSPVTMPEVEEMADAILWVWYPGQEGGAAVGDVIFGDVVPSGRLPITFPRSVDQLPDYEDYSMMGRTYKYMTEKPLYPFGYGLSYTSFGYGDANISKTKWKKGENLTVSVEVTNTGELRGDEVVQFYLSRPDAGVGSPFYSLEGVKRVTLEPGQSVPVQFEITPDMLGSFQEDGQKKILKGEYKVTVSAASPGERSRELGVDNRIELAFTY